jgi:hypothetical protein
VRHPCDTLLSCFLQNFRAPGVAMLCSDLGTLAKVYERVFRYWYDSPAPLRDPGYELQFERLVADLPAEVTSLSRYLGIPMDPAMLEPAKRARAKEFISTPSYTQVIEPVSNRPVGRWKHYQSHFESVLPVLKPWIEHWGYAL